MSYKMSHSVTLPRTGNNTGTAAFIAAVQPVTGQKLT